jgi:hypothetical protein
MAVWLIRSGTESSSLLFIRYDKLPTTVRRRLDSVSMQGAGRGLADANKSFPHSELGLTTGPLKGLEVRGSRS